MDKLLSILLAFFAIAAPTAPACRADGHNAHRSKAAIKNFKKAHSCPSKCATYIKENGKFKLYLKCGRCQVDHICALACCGSDTPDNMQWLTSEENNKKSDDCSLCKKVP